MHKVKLLTTLCLSSCLLALNAQAAPIQKACLGDLKTFDGSIPLVLESGCTQPLHRFNDNANIKVAFSVTPNVDFYRVDCSYTANESNKRTRNGAINGIVASKTISISKDIMSFSNKDHAVTMMVKNNGYNKNKASLETFYFDTGIELNKRDSNIDNADGTVNCTITPTPIIAINDNSNPAPATTGTTPPVVDGSTTTPP